MAEAERHSGRERQRRGSTYRDVKGHSLKLDTFDLSIQEVPATAAFFRDVVCLIPRVSEERYAEFDVGPAAIMLSPEV